MLMNRWRSMYEELLKKHDYIKRNSPATQQQISDVETKLGVTRPDDIKSYLSEFNGDDWVVFSAEQLVETNLSVRSFGCFMPLDCLLFIAGNGCGDYYGYPITSEDGVRDDNIYLWEHENDSRIWKASNLEDAIHKYYNDEI